jgi:hypothetical protein
MQVIDAAEQLERQALQQIESDMQAKALHILQSIDYEKILGTGMRQPVLWGGGEGRSQLAGHAEPFLACLPPSSLPPNPLNVTGNLVRDLAMVRCRG